MSTRSSAKISKIEDPVCQGDIFENVKYNYIDSESSTDVSIVEFTFPLAIIISQACDVIAMDELVNNGGGKPNKFMPSILMCPIYDDTDARQGENIKGAFESLSLEFVQEQLYNSKDYNLIKNDWHYRFHALEVEADKKTILENCVVDFKHYFTVPINYLLQHKEDRILHLNDLYAEQITLKFSSFLSRVAIPAIDS